MYSDKIEYHVEMTDSIIADLIGLNGDADYEYCGKVFHSLSSLLKWILTK